MTDTAVSLLTWSITINDMLRELDMHAEQHRDGLQFGLIPDTDAYGIYNESLLFVNKRSTAQSRRFATVYMTLRPYDEKDAARYGWTMPYSQDPAFVPQIKYGPLAQVATGRLLSLDQVRENLTKLRALIWDAVRQNLKFTPRQDTITTYFALQMVASSPDTDWHIQPLVFNPHLQQYLVSGVHAPLIFAALASLKKGATRRGHQHSADIQQPRFSAAEAQTWDSVHLQLAFDLLRIDFFDGN